MLAPPDPPKTSVGPACAAVASLVVLGHPPLLATIVKPLSGFKQQPSARTFTLNNTKAKGRGCILTCVLNLYLTIVEELITKL